MCVSVCVCMCMQVLACVCMCLYVHILCLKMMCLCVCVFLWRGVNFGRLRYSLHLFGKRKEETHTYHISTRIRQAEVTKDVMGGPWHCHLRIGTYSEVHDAHADACVCLRVCACCVCVWCSMCVWCSIREKGKALLNKRFAVDRLKRGCHMSVCLCVMLGFIQS